MAKKRRESSVEEKYEEVRQLIGLGRERGYLAIDEINGLLPEEISNSPEDIEETFSVFDAHGIEIVDVETKEQLKVTVSPGQPKAKEDGKKPPKNAPEKKHTIQDVCKAASLPPWNSDLKVLLWKIGESFMKVSSNPKSFYGLKYVEQKALEIKADDLLSVSYADLLRS